MSLKEEEPINESTTMRGVKRAAGHYKTHSPEIGQSRRNSVTIGLLVPRLRKSPVYQHNRDKQVVLSKLITIQGTPNSKSG